MGYDYKLDDEIEFVGRLGMRLYPKSVDYDNNFKVVACSIDKQLGDIPIPLNSFKNIVIAGNLFPQVINYNEREFVGDGILKDFDEKVKDTKYHIKARVSEIGGSYGINWNVKQCYPYLDIDDRQSNYDFLKPILTELQLKNLFDIYDCPVKLLEDRNEENKEKLMEVKGIKEIMVEKLYDKFSKRQGFAYMMSSLKDFEFTDSIIEKIRNYYDSMDEAIMEISNNPYCIADIKGIGFSTADKHAEIYGIGVTDLRRLRAYIKFVLNDIAYNDGDTWISSQELVNYIDDDLGVHWELETIGDVIQDMKDRQILYDGEKGVIALRWIHDLERQIAYELDRINSAPIDKKKTDAEIETIIHRLEKKQGFEYTDEQKSGAYEIQDNNVLVITGKSGTGKSSTAQLALESTDSYTPVAVALAGKAVARLDELTDNLQTSTIHRHLGSKLDKGNWVFAHNHKNQLPNDAVLTDEYGMLGLKLFRDLLIAIPTGTKLIILGDVRQLSAIGVGNLGQDLLTSKEIPIIILNEIHRQAKKSGIPTEAGKISDQKTLYNSGKQVYGELKDFTMDLWDSPPTGQDKPTIDKMVEYYKDYLDNGIEPHQITCILPMKTRGTNTIDLNNKLQVLANPNAEIFLDDKIIVTKGKSDETLFELKKNDILINNQNNYNTIVVKKNNKNGKWMPIVLHENFAHLSNSDIDRLPPRTKQLLNKDLDYYNKEDGEMIKQSIRPLYNGTLLDLFEFVKSRDGRITGAIVYDGITDNYIYVNKSHCTNSIKLGYCLTGHKMQGSENDYIIIGLDTTHYKLLSKEWLYTAITRAQKECILVGETYAVNTAVRSSETTDINTFLPNYLK